jgi:hemophore-related protein
LGAIRWKETPLIKSPLTGLAAAVAGLALSLTVGPGAASADPDMGPIVNTTCNYSQVMAALNAQDPAAAGKFNSSPIAQSYLRQFLAAPPSQRQAMAQQAMSTPGAAQQFGIVQQVAATCNNF